MQILGEMVERLPLHFALIFISSDAYWDNGEGLWVGDNVLLIPLFFKKQMSLFFNSQLLLIEYQ